MRWFFLNERRRAVREAVWERDGYVCFYCDEPVTAPLRGRSQTDQPPTMATVDHIIPRAYGGGFIEGNLVTACLRCNNSRGDKPASEYLAARRKSMSRRKSIALCGAEPSP